MPTDRREWNRLLLALLACGVAYGLSAWYAAGRDPWYSQLDLPPFSPPDWLFTTIWPALHVLIAVALFLVWRRKPLGRIGETGVAWFFIQLVFGVAWMWFLFGLRLPFFAFLEVLMVLFGALIAAVDFYRLVRLAGLLMLPYIGWLAFAAYWNYWLWKLNVI